MSTTYVHDLRAGPTKAKFVDEVVTYTCQFATFPQIAAGASISSATATSTPGGLTVSASASGTNVLVTASGGSDGTKYEVTALATLNDATPSVIGVRFQLQVE